MEGQYWVYKTGWQIEANGVITIISKLHFHWISSHFDAKEPVSNRGEGYADLTGMSELFLIDILPFRSQLHHIAIWIRHVNAKSNLYLG